VAGPQYGTQGQEFGLAFGHSSIHMPQQKGRAGFCLQTALFCLTCLDFKEKMPAPHTKQTKITSLEIKQHLQALSPQEGGVNIDWSFFFYCFVLLCILFYYASLTIIFYTFTPLHFLSPFFLFLSTHFFIALLLIFLPLIKFKFLVYSRY
jgi:hypothetical protein